MIRSVVCPSYNLSISSTLTLQQAIDIPPATSAVLGIDVLVLSGMPFTTPDRVDLSVGIDTGYFPVGQQKYAMLLVKRRR